jgi:hypothetical protein
MANAHRVRRRALTFLVLSLTCAAPAFAQRAAGPYSGVLGTTDDASGRHTLIFRSSLFGAWDDIITENFSDVSESDVDNRFLRSGLAGGAQGGLTHARRTNRMRWLSSADSELRMYGSDGDALAATFAGRTALDADVNSRVTVGLGGGWSYSPYYDLSPSYGSQSRSVGSFGGGFGVATAAERNMVTDGDGRISVRLSRRDTLEASGNARYWKFLDQDENTVTSYGARGRYRRSLSTALGVFAGFARDQSQYRFADADDLTTDTIDVGIDYGDTLEFSRRAALSFNFATSATRWEDETHWRVNGSAALTRAFGRTGSGLLQYQRAMEPAAGFREPLLSDTFSGAFSNQIGRDTSWSVNAGYVRGETGFGDDARRYDVYDAGARITRALTRNLGVFGDYTYYRYDVPAGSTVFTFLPKFSRQSVSFGLTVWAPIINDTRPPRER